MPSVCAGSNSLPHFFSKFGRSVVVHGLGRILDVEDLGRSLMLGRHRVEYLLRHGSVEKGAETDTP